MKFLDTTTLYSRDNVMFVFLSIIVFTMYGIMNLIDINSYILDLGIGTQIINVGEFLYSYIVGYIALLMKTTTSMITLYALISAIWIGSITLFNIFRPNGPDFSSSMFSKIQQSLRQNALWILGIFFIERTIITYFAFAPICILIVFLGYSLSLYDKEMLQDMNENGKGMEINKALYTYHNHALIFLSMFVLTLILFTMGVYSNGFTENNTIN